MKLTFTHWTNENNEIVRMDAFFDEIGRRLKPHEGDLAKKLTLSRRLTPHFTRG